MLRQYHRINPDVKKDTYTEFDQVEWTTSFQGQSLLSNEVYLSGRIAIFKGGNRINDGADHQLFLNDSHDIFQDIFVSTQKQGQIEELKYYPRHVKQVRNLTQTKSDQYRASSAREMRVSQEAYQQYFLRGFGRPANGNDAEIVIDPDFVTKPLICLNSVVDGTPLNFSHTAEVKIMINLARTVNLLYGSSMDDTVTYQVSDLQLMYATVPELSKQLPIRMTAHLAFNSLLESNNAVIKTRPRGICTAYTATVMKNTHVDQNQRSNTTCETIPGLIKVNFLFNDSLNQLYKFELKQDEREEILKSYIEAMGSSHNDISPRSLNLGLASGIGVSFPAMDLTNQSFTIQIDSAISNVDKYQLWSYFKQSITI